MGDADHRQRRAGAPAAAGTCRLGRLVQRRAGLVEEQPVRPDQQRAREREPLLLAAATWSSTSCRSRPGGRRSGRAGRRRAPRGSPASLVRLRAGRGSTAPPAACRSGCRASAAGTGPWRPRGRCTVPLPNGHRPASTRNSVVLPLPEGPWITRRCPGRIVEVDMLEQHPPVGQRHVDVMQRQSRPAAVRPDRSRARSPGRLGPLHGLAERGQPVDGGLPAGQSAVVSTNQDSEPWTWPKAPAVCVSMPKRDLAGEVARRRDDEREDAGGLRRRRRSARSGACCISCSPTRCRRSGRRRRRDRRSSSGSPS